MTAGSLSAIPMSVYLSFSRSIMLGPRYTKKTKKRPIPKKTEAAKKTSSVVAPKKRPKRLKTTERKEVIVEVETPEEKCSSLSPPVGAMVEKPRSAEGWLQLGQSVGEKDTVAFDGTRFSKCDCFVEAVRADPKSSAAWWALGRSMPRGQCQKYIDQSPRPFPPPPVYNLCKKVAQSKKRVRQDYPLVVATSSSAVLYLFLSPFGDNYFILGGRSFICFQNVVKGMFC